ncbi:MULTISPECIES: alpha/beta fold hydrolase [unclassified Pseudofrankia]|uniref:alpha/beta fold hydrolase n=1 Tax=unclassified Pseudofrankia TaxID=2994372 RepID=UPI0008DB1EBB|nr:MULTISPECIES: alpha/beta hydrolase [unclassified Pseudofrankia]MDT3439571.1 alpha/beta hydrolase [Pseudofrankia sp. BMG5.37]OHV48778.1 hypothetical protein BCD48_15075 [Pseudofrankia sp. BMG5.36]
MSDGATAVVLLHGECEDGSVWAAVIRLLREAGVDVTAPAVQLRSLEGDARYVRDVSWRIPGPVLLVGHGYGAAVASVAAAHLANAVGVVFVAGFVLAPAQSVVDVVSTPRGRTYLASLRPEDFLDSAGNSVSELRLGPGEYADTLAADLPAVVTSPLAVAQRPVAAAALEERASSAGWTTLPSWYLVAASDRFIDPDLQRAMAERAGSVTREVNASHLVPVSQPGAVVAVVQEALSGCNRETRHLR